MSLPSGYRLSAHILLVLGLWLGAGRVVLAAPDTDTDGDLIPDAWEVQWGLDPQNPADADLDPDGDRLTHRDEFHAGTNPAVANPADTLTDAQLLRLFQGKAFVYFWEQSRSYYYFTADNADYNNPASYSANFNSIATTGFSLVAYAVADERGWVAHATAYERTRALLARAVALQSPTYDVLAGQGYPQGNRRGYLYHFVDDYGFKSGPEIEISTVDHAFLVAGALTAGEYYKGTEVEQLARQLYLNTDWNWLYNTNALPHLWQSWREPTPCQPWQTPYDGGCVFDEWNRYSELLALMFLAMGHPDPEKAIPSTAWSSSLTHNSDLMFPFEWAHLTTGSAPQNFSFVPNVPNTLDRPGFQNSATELHFLFAGSLHNHQYAHLFADFRARPDGLGTNYFNNSIAATLANRQYCIRLNETGYGGDINSPDPYARQPYETYGPNTWGLMAGLASNGYQTLQPITIPTEDFSPTHLAVNNDSGTVVLSAPLGSVPFAPRQVADALKDYLSRFQQNVPGFDALIGRYGFRNAFNLGRTINGQVGHFPSQTIGLDLGPAIGSADNFLTGMPWKFAMRNDYLRQGMQLAGFETGDVEPVILNFDDAPPLPHEDPNGGGQDPNSFGGYAGAWGTGSIQYLSIGDPFPGQPFGPQEWAQQISVADSGSGGFLTLNRHSVSHRDRLSFWVRGSAGQEAFLVGLKDVATDSFGAPLQQTEVKVPIADYHPAGQVTTTWTEVRIPLRVFADGGVRLTALDNVSFTGAGPAGTIEVDDIAFLGDEFTPAPPTNVQLGVEASAVTLTWDAHPEPDVVGYRVYRSEDGEQYAALNATLAVAASYTDPSPGLGTHFYRVTAVDYAQPPQESAPSATVSTPHINQPPQLQLIGNKTVAEGNLLSFQVMAADPDGTTPVLSAVRAGGGALAGIGAFFTDQGDGNGMFAWTPTFAQAGSYRIRFKALDASGGLKDIEVITITVTDVVPPPPTLVFAAPAIGRTVSLANGFVVRGRATAASGTVVDSLKLRVWDIFQGTAKPMGLLPLEVTNLHTPQARWKAMIPGNLVPAGHSLRVRILSQSAPPATARSRKGIVVSPQGLVQADPMRNP